MTLNSPISLVTSRASSRFLHSEVALEVDNLRREYGGRTVLDSLSFRVRRGEVVGLLGPNGAGKTTTISVVLGVLRATAGVVRVGGMDINANRGRALAKTNFSASYGVLPGNLTVAENLYFFGHLYSIRSLGKRIDELVEGFALTKVWKVKCGLLSSGEQARVGLAKALLNRPELLLLDEPTASLDPAVAKWVRSYIMQYSKDGNSGILWTSHNMDEVANVCDHVIFLARGRILLEGDPNELVRAQGTRTLEELFIKVAHWTQVSQ